MDKISQSVVKKDHEPKMSGRSVYVGDYAGDGILTGKFLRSKLARAKLLSVEIPELPEGYYYVDQNDVPGDNNVNIVLDDTPVYARDTVEYIGEPIGMVVGPDEKVVDRILSEIKVSYEELEPVLDLRQAETVFFNYEYEKGDLSKAFAEADKVYKEEFSTGYQDQTYLEPQGMMAEPEENGHMYVHGSMQCAYYVHGAVMRALGCRPDEVHILQDVNLVRPTAQGPHHRAVDIIGTLHGAVDVHMAVFLRLRHHPLGFQIGLILITGGEFLFIDLIRLGKRLAQIAFFVLIIKEYGLGLAEIQHRLQFLIGNLDLRKDPIHDLLIRANHHADGFSDVLHCVAGIDRSVIQHDIHVVVAGNVVLIHIVIALRQLGNFYAQQLGPSQLGAKKFTGQNAVACIVSYIDGTAGHFGLVVFFHNGLTDFIHSSITASYFANS